MDVLMQQHSIIRHDTREIEMTSVPDFCVFVCGMHHVRIGNIISILLPLIYVSADAAACSEQRAV